MKSQQAAHRPAAMVLFVLFCFLNLSNDKRIFLNYEIASKNILDFVFPLKIKNGISNTMGPVHLPAETQ